MRPIDADVLIDKLDVLISNALLDDTKIHYALIRKLIFEQPVIETGSTRSGHWECGGFFSVCGLDTTEYKPSFCPHCGSRMYGGAENVEKNCENCAKETCTVMPPIGKCYCDFWQEMPEPPESEGGAKNDTGRSY